MAIDVGKDFYHRLANRNKMQGDGRHTAVEFRTKFLGDFDNAKVWGPHGPTIELDFSNVKKIGPSFANEAFAYFTRFTTPETFLRRVVFVNISKIQRMIIEEELRSGYAGR